MKIHLISGACGFVGRNMVNRLYNTTEDKLFIVDDLSIGTHPSTWMEYSKSTMTKDLELIGEDERIYFWKGDFRDLLFRLRMNPRHIQETYELEFDRFSDVFHFAAIVGGRLKI